MSFGREIKQHHAFLREGVDACRRSSAQSTAGVLTQFAHSEIVNEEIDYFVFLVCAVGVLGITLLESFGDACFISFPF